MTAQAATLSFLPPRAASANSALGVVAIGRNEGERLRQCLASAHIDNAASSPAPVVYVDSASTDSSVSLAREMGVEVVELDLAVGFTAARARNAGLDCLLAANPGLEFVQFVDGDCQIVEGWLDQAQKYLRDCSDIAVVCGRRRERFPEVSVYNRLCDIEWNTPPGETTWCGGDSLMRVKAVLQAGKFNAALIAGEEPELCLRLRRLGWKIMRLDAEMTLHDAAITRWVQWWKRGMRAGYAFAEGAALHGGKPERYCVRESLSGWIWGMILPLLVLAAAWPTRGVSLAALLLYPLLGLRFFIRGSRRNLGLGPALAYAFFAVLGKFPQAAGQMKFVFARMTGQRSTVIEYKSGTP